ncbi:MAG: hypothetical protein ACYDBZ_06100 [Steroidobacteraceae bacterium]
MKVLIVDDVNINRTLLRVEFEADGHTTLEAADGIEALQIIARLTISSTAMPKFFDVFSSGESLTPRGDLGLGPAVARRILCLFGGSVSVENLEPAGIRLTISLPLPA